MQKVLSEELNEHIRKSLPGLQMEFQEKLISLENEIADYERLFPEDRKAKNRVLLG